MKNKIPYLKELKYALATTFMISALLFMTSRIINAGVSGGGGSSSVEGTAVLSTGETGGTKYLREDGDGTCSFQTPELYAMDQDLLTTSTPTFAGLNLTGTGQSRMPNGIEVNYSSGTAVMDRLVIWGSAGKELIGTDPNTNITYLGGRTNGLQVAADGATSFIGSAIGGVIHGEGHDFNFVVSSGNADANGYNVYPAQDFSCAVTFSTYWAVCSTGTAVITTYVGYSTQPPTNTTGQANFIDSTITASSTTYTGGTFTANGAIAAGKGLIIKISGMAADAIVKIYGKFTKD